MAEFQARNMKGICRLNILKGLIFWEKILTSEIMYEVTINQAENLRIKLISTGFNFTMPNSHLEHKVSHLFKTIIEGEKQLEAYRQVLVEQPDFDPYLTFVFLDKSETGHLSPLSIVQFLNEHNIEVLEADVNGIFANTGHKEECSMNFSEFLTIILPRASPSLRQLSLFRDPTRTPKKKNASLTYEVKWALARVLEKQVNFGKSIDNCRSAIAKFGDFVLPEVFKAIDINNDDTLDIDSIYIFLKKNKVYVSENDVIVLLRSIDNINDGRMSYFEFLQVVQPNSPQLLHYSGMNTSFTNTTKCHSRCTSPKKNRSPSKTRSKSPCRSSPIANRKNSRSPSKEKRFISPQKIKSNTPGKHLKDNSLLSYSTVTRAPNYRDKSPSDYSSIVKVPVAMNTSVGGIVYNSYKTPEKQRKQEQEHRSAVYEDKNTGEKRHRKSQTSHKKDNIHEILTENDMNQDEERELASVLREQITLDSEVEAMKNELAMQSDFNVMDIYRLFDDEGKGSLDKYELMRGLGLFLVTPSKKELYLLMKRFDRDRDGLLRIVDFANIIEPRNTNKDISYPFQKKLPRVLSMNITFLLRKTLQTILSNESCSECLRRRLHSRPGFSLYKAFKALDRNMNGYLKIDDFRVLLSSHGFFASQKELNGFMGRFDKNGDDRVSYNDFVEEMKPRAIQKPKKH